MWSRTSFFDKTLFRKNLTRFAPVWGLYTLCLVLGTLLVYSNGGMMKQWHFAANLAEMPQYLALINLIYAPVVIQLLFGDLYNSRMCYAIHAMPIRREGWFFTNLAAGLVFSVVPSLVMTLLSMLLCGGSLIANAWQIPWLTLAANTLEYLCFFGIAVFAAMCSANRLGMGVIYGLMNAGAYIAYWLIDTVYTPLLYGVITPSQLAETLTPISRMVDDPYILINDSLYHLREIFGEELQGASSTFRLVPENWKNVAVWALAGLGFTVVALLLYKRRNLECAGDTLAFKRLEPVFQVLGSVVTAAAAQFFLYMFLGTSASNYLFLAAGLLVGWFLCRMLIERTTRVFRMKNWVGLAGLTTALVLSLFLTHVDILGVEDWQPEPEEVASVHISAVYGHEFTEEADIQLLLAAHAEGLQTRLERGGNYVRGEDGTWVHFQDSQWYPVENLEDLMDLECRKVFSTTITYTLENGKEVSRRLYVWSDGTAGNDLQQLLSRWDVVAGEQIYHNITGEPTGELVLDVIRRDPERLYIDGMDKALEDPDTILVEELLAALRADSAAGALTQADYLQSGHFRVPNPEMEHEFYHTSSLGINLSSEDYGWYVQVYPQCQHTLRWLEANGFLVYEPMPNSLVWY